MPGLARVRTVGVTVPGLARVRTVGVTVPVITRAPALPSPPTPLHPGRTLW